MAAKIVDEREIAYTVEPMDYEQQGFRTRLDSFFKYKIEHINLPFN